MSESETLNPQILLADEIQSIRSVLGREIPIAYIIRALSTAGNNVDRAINVLLDTPPLSEPKPVNKEADPQLEPTIKVEKEDCEMGFPEIKTKNEEIGTCFDKKPIFMPEIVVKKEETDETPLKIVKMEDTLMTDETPLKIVKMEDTLMPNENPLKIVKKEESLIPENRVKEEPDVDVVELVKKEEHDVKMENSDMDFKKDEAKIPKKKSLEEEFDEYLATTHCAPYLNPRPIRAIMPGVVTDRRIQILPDPNSAEIGEFPEEPDWFLVAKTYVTGLSTCRGKRKLEADEIIHFSFPKNDVRKQFGRQWVSAKTAAATSEIVRFSTKRSGEIGRLPTEWSRCLIPLVNSSKVKVRGRCVSPPVQLGLMQEIILYVSFYIHGSIFTQGEKSSWKLVAPSQVDSTLHPLLTLFNLLKIKPTQKAEFTPQELDTRKRSLNLKDHDDDEQEQIVGLAKRRRRDKTYPEQSNEEQAISESSLNKLVGAAELYNLQEAEPPSTLTCKLWPYQKQALFWMSELEKGIDVEEATKTLHPCWAAYRICDARASAIYVNVFSGEATTQFPSATQMARGGILADAMGLGKTVMTISLILQNLRGKSDEQDTVMLNANASGEKPKRASQMEAPSSTKGGTLIVCPMALLGQWKDELETHSGPDSISIFVHYGGDRTNNPKELAKYHVVLTTYGVLASSYKTESEKASIFHRIDWYRVVLDEAHTIKSSKARVSQSAFALTSHCRWCLTGTPLQNNLEDLYSLLCFLHVEPWCNWAWWHKLIQKPYENGDERGLRLVKAILRPLMLRRTKDTKDKDGRPILVLPPANVQIIECEQSEEERDFYDALFKRSKVRFDQFVAQGKVLHNYASILELLLRLRQCCNHPFLVLSRGDTQQYADLNKLAHRFLEGANMSSAPTREFVEEVVDGIRRGEVSECPICLESASDDPVLTPCAHRMCRECLLSSWRTPASGPCPLCRRPLTKADLITCPTESRFQVDVEKNWKESSKVTELIRSLENIQKSGSGEKSIVFSQWTSFMDLLEIPLKRKRIGYLRFDGKLSQKNRERVLKEFSENKAKPVLLMSLRAGGVGLNLTAASNVFLMDPWWNPAVEEQAIMRIHRIGQKRQVRVRRFIVKDTVEERMQQVQARKQKMIAGALTDEEVRSARIEELKMLFR